MAQASFQPKTSQPRVLLSAPYWLGDAYLSFRLFLSLHHLLAFKSKCILLYNRRFHVLLQQSSELYRRCYCLVTCSGSLNVTMIRLRYPTIQVSNMLHPHWLGRKKSGRNCLKLSEFCFSRNRISRIRLNSFLCSRLYHEMSSVVFG